MQTIASLVPQYCFWLMIVSMATAVLPVLRSPMMSSRWPRPMGIMLSTALMPVCMGSWTGWRSAMPGAMMSTLRNSVALIGALVVLGGAQRVNDAAQDGLAHGHLEEAAGGLHHVAFLHLQVVAVDDRADGVDFEVEDLAHDRALAGLELEEFAGHGLGEAVDAGDAVADFHHAANLGDLQVGPELLDFLADDGRDFISADLHGMFLREP